MLASINNGVTRLFDHPDLGRLILRLTVGILLLFHGTAKIENGVGWIANMLAAKGFPAFVAYGAYIGEVVAPVMIIIGLLTRPAALIIAVNMVVATLLVKMGDLTARTQVGAWALEAEAFFLLGAVVILLIGAGRYVLIRNPRWQ